MVVWFSTLGWSSNAVLNTIWYYCNKFSDFPQKVILFYNEAPDVTKNKEIVRQSLKKMGTLCNAQQNVDVSFIPVPSDGIKEYAEIINKETKPYLVKKDKNVIFDITPGRKYMSIILCNIALENREAMKYVLYNHIASEKLFDLPFPLIPYNKNQVVNILEYSGFLSASQEIENSGCDDEKAEKTSKGSTFITPTTDKLSLYCMQDELISIINFLHDACLYDLSIEAMPAGVEIFKIQLQDKIKLTVVPNAEQALDKVRAELKEVAGRDDFLKELLFMAGILKPLNMKEIEAKVLELYDFNPLQGDLPFALSFDSNLFRNRFYTLFNNTIVARNEILPRIYYLLPNKVSEELSYFDKKYKDNDVDALKRYVVKISTRIGRESQDWYNKLTNSVMNQLAFEDRLRRIGFVESILCTNSRRCHTVAKDTTVRSNDLQIINPLRDYARDHNMRILLLSEDRDFIARSKANPNVIPFLVDYPRGRVPDQFSIEPMELCQLLYCCALYFGGVLIKKDGNAGDKHPLFMCQGIWTGKDDESWNAEKLKITGRSDILKQSDKNLKLIQAMQQ